MKNNIYPSIIILFTSLFFLNFFGKGFLIGYLLLPLLYINVDLIKKSIEPGFVLIFLFSVSYSLFYKLSPGSQTQFFIMYMVFPNTLYLVGRFMVFYFQSERKLFYLLFCITVIFSFRALFSVFSIFLLTGFGMTLEYGRNLPILWDGDYNSATLVAMYFSCNMSIPAILITKSIIKDKFFVIVSLFIFLITTICVLRIGSRTQLVICIFLLLLSFLVTLPKQSIGKNFRLIGIISLLVLYIATNVSFDLDAEWLSSYANRLENSGNTMSGGGRTELWGKSIVNLVIKPFGWSYDEFGFSHNMWLDVARVGGLVSFILLGLFTIKALLLSKKAYSLIQNKGFKMMVLCYMISFILVFSAEPILDATVYLFPLFCFFIGILSGVTQIKVKI